MGGWVRTMVRTQTMPKTHGLFQSRRGDDVTTDVATSDARRLPASLVHTKQVLDLTADDSRLALGSPLSIVCLSSTPINLLLFWLPSVPHFGKFWLLFQSLSPQRGGQRGGRRSVGGHECVERSASIHSVNIHVVVIITVSWKFERLTT